MIKMNQIKRILKAISKEVSKVRPIVLDYISIDSILFDPSIAETFYFKHDVGDSNVVNVNNFLANLSLIGINDAFAVLTQSND